MQLTIGYSSYIWLINYVIQPRIIVRSLKPFLVNTLAVIVFVVSPLLGFSQIRCGTVEYTEKLKTQNLFLEDKGTFEKWIQQRQEEKARRSNAQRTTAAFQVPVVVHVIHNGEAIGVGKNISDAQILSQISVLNKDYNRLNSDADNTPAEFLPLAGIFNVEFVLARQTPEGLATNGIVRVQGSKTSWTINDNYTLKGLSYWPAEDYLNIWVCNLTDFLGYSQFPVSGLPGLENSSTNRLTDGVVISFNAFGSSDDGNFNLQSSYNKGRTATHEIGHFFGLRHIWGDDNGACSGTDYVNDTPNQAGSTSGCPSHPRVTCTSITSMFQNYLDYTNDQCMNLFTKGQADRMVIVIENSPRRASLTSSHGLSDPVPVANDLGIKMIISPQTGQCTTPFIPSVEVRNYGNNIVSSARVRVRKDGVITETRDFSFSPAIPLLGAAVLNFNSISFSSGDHSVSFEILTTNGASDGNSMNNSETQNLFVPQSIAIPFVENFNTVPATWEIVNPDQYLTWELTNTPVNGSNKAMKMEFYNYEDHVGEIDLLITPAFDLSTEPAALLKFDVAYSQYQSSNDGLKVVVLNNCNADLSQGTVVYNKSGQSLATVSTGNSEFTPNGGDQWRKEAIDLSAFIGQQNLQLAFVGLNDWGNNLYLDNISLTTTPVNDVALIKVVAPSPVLCANQVSPLLRIKNSGTLLHSLTVTTTINGQSSIESFSELNLGGNLEMEIELAPKSLNNGENTLTFELSNPNGDDDFNPDDNTLQVISRVNQVEDDIPLQQNFDGSFESSWTINSPSGGMLWEKIPVIGNPALYYNAFDNIHRGEEAWLVSPVLDFSNVEGASISYDLSYAMRNNTSDVLYVLASRDCGIVFRDTIATLSGPTLSDGRTSDTSWKPSDQSKWTNKSHILSFLAGEPSVRIAFVAKNNNGNNMYLDSLEFFLSDSPIKLKEIFSVYPNPVSQDEANITFNLPEKGPVILEIIDPMGKVLIKENLPDILNQTYPFRLTNASSGVYIVRLFTGGKVFFKKLIVLD